MHKFNRSDNGYVIFDAGGGIVYVISAYILKQINNIDALSAFLTNQFVTLPKNSSVNDYINIINSVSRRPDAVKKAEKLSATEMDVLRLMAYKFLVPPVLYASLDVTKEKMKRWSFHKRSGLQKMGLKNDNIFYSLVASWHACYSQITSFKL